MTKLALGIAGCGGHAVHHARHLGELFTLVGAYDLKREAADGIGAERVYDTLEDMLADPRISAVLVCSRDEAHLEQSMAALRAGKHVFCEKPLLVPGQDMSELVAMFALARERGLVFSTCHLRRKDRPFMWLQDQLPGLIERFGKVLHFAFDFSYHEPSEPWKAARSLLLDHINHEIDLMSFLFGLLGFEAMQVRDGFNHYEVFGMRDDDISFHLQGTRRLAKGTYPEWCEIRFERGKVVLDMMMGVARVHDHAEHTITTYANLAIDYGGRLAGVMTDFGQEILHGSTGYLSFSEMYMNTEAGIVLQQQGWQRVNTRKLN